MAETPASIDQRDGSYIDWPCVVGGAVAAAAISLVLLTFGSAIGMSVVSPWPSSGVSSFTLVLMASAWMVLVQVASYSAGGYLAGRMRRPWGDAKESEVEFRDGAHGALVWAVGVLISAFMLASVVAGAASTAANVAGNAATATAATSGEPVTGLALDTLFRSNRPPQEGQAAREGDYRGQASRVLANAIMTSEMSSSDRTFLTEMVVARTGLPPADAEQRINLLVNNAKATIDSARRVSIVAAFLTAAALLAGAAAAWVAARLAGGHRNQGIVWRGFARRDAPWRALART